MTVGGAHHYWSMLHMPFSAISQNMALLCLGLLPTQTDGEGFGWRRDCHVKHDGSNWRRRRRLTGLLSGTMSGLKVELYRILKIRTREPRLLSVFSKLRPVNWFFGSFLGLLEGLLSKRPGFLNPQLSKLAKDPTFGS